MGDDNIKMLMARITQQRAMLARHFSRSFREEAAEILKSKSSIHTNTHSHAGVSVTVPDGCRSAPRTKIYKSKQQPGRV